MGKNKLKPKLPPVDPLPEPELLDEGKAKKEESASKPEEEEASEQELQRRERRRLRRERLRSALDGSVLLEKGVQKYGGLVLFIFLLAMFLIADNYFSESTVRECAIIKGELKELQFRQISSQAELMRLSRQSSVADKLQGTGVKESVVPPYKIREDKPARNRKK